MDNFGKNDNEAFVKPQISKGELYSKGLLSDADGLVLGENQKPESGVSKFFKRVFVHNILYKALAVVVSAAIWVLSVGLG